MKDHLHHLPPLSTMALSLDQQTKAPPGPHLLPECKAQRLILVSSVLRNNDVGSFTLEVNAGLWHR